MKVAVAQMNCRPGNLEANFASIREQTRWAAEQDCDVIVFPEMADTGYEMQAIREKSSGLEEASFRAMAEIARQQHIHLIVGLGEREGERIYNSLAVFDPGGELIAKYRKVHLADYPPLNEGAVITPGDARVGVEIAGMTWGLMICYDLRFPEMSRSLALDGAEVLVYSAAWPFPRLRHWEILLRARAIENQAYVVAANHTGKEGEVIFCGASRIIDPYGVIKTAAAENRSELLIAEIQPELLQEVRERMPVFRHRREAVYRAPGED